MEAKNSPKKVHKLVMESTLKQEPVNSNRGSREASPNKAQRNGPSSTTSSTTSTPTAQVKQATIKELNDKIAVYKVQVTAMDKLLKEKYTEADAIRDYIVLETVRAKNNQLTHTIQQLEQDKASLISKLDTLKQQYTRLKQSEMSLKRDSSSNNLSVNENNSSLDAAKAENKLLRQKVTDLEIRLNETEEKHSRELREKVQVIEEKCIIISKKTKQIRDLEAQLDRSRSNTPVAAETPKIPVMKPKPKSETKVAVKRKLPKSEAPVQPVANGGDTNSSSPSSDADSVDNTTQNSDESEEGAQPPKKIAFVVPQNMNQAVAESPKGNNSVVQYDSDQIRRLMDDETRARCCVVCWDDDESNENFLITCVRCQYRVHRTCFGLVQDDFDPNDWTCCSCQGQLDANSNEPARCALCPSDGPMKPLSTEWVNRFNKKKYKYAHILCATFMPNIQFKDPIAMSPITCLEYIEADRLNNLKCDICKLRMNGACVQCNFDGDKKFRKPCYKSVHVTCAAASPEFLLMICYTKNEMADIIDNEPEMTSLKLIYCAAHFDIAWDKMQASTDEEEDFAEPCIYGHYNNSRNKFTLEVVNAKCKVPKIKPPKRGKKKGKQ